MNQKNMDQQNENTVNGHEANTSHEKMTFEQATLQLIREGHEEMIEASVRENRVYHTENHPDTLIKRAGLVYEIFDTTEKQKLLSEFAIMKHDAVISVTRANPEDIVATITRHRGAREGDLFGAEGNEGKSARRAELAMFQVNERAGVPVFLEEDIKTVGFAVEATYPEIKAGAHFKEYPNYEAIAKQNPKVAEVIDWLEEQGIDKGLLFFQPHLEKPLEGGDKVPPEVLVMILDDLGGPGLASPEQFAEEGDKEFQELFENIKKPENFKRLTEGDEEKDENDRKKASSAMIGWLKSQPGFAAWQMLRIEKITILLQKNGQLTDAKTAKLHSVFNKFEGNVKSALVRAQETEKKFNDIKAQKGSKTAFKFLAESMHYQNKKDAI